jgi:hypothetical protein
MRLRKTAALFLVSALLLCGARAALGCSPDFPRVILTYTIHPDLPLDEFAGGRLGVLQPTFARSYLFVAYRYLSAVPLDEDERQAVLDFWDGRLNPAAGWYDTDAGPWLAERSRIPGTGPAGPIDAFGRIRYQEYLNCPPDAFKTAAATLERRAMVFGSDSAAMRDWVHAQDPVFANCFKVASIPDPAPADAPSLLRADRAYQIAAARFYAGDFDAASWAISSKSLSAASKSPA